MKLINGYRESSKFNKWHFDDILSMILFICISYTQVNKSTYQNWEFSQARYVAQPNPNETTQCIYLFFHTLVANESQSYGTFAKMRIFSIINVHNCKMRIFSILQQVYLSTLRIFSRMIGGTRIFYLTESMFILFLEYFSIKCASVLCLCS